MDTGSIGEHKTHKVEPHVKYDRLHACAHREWILVCIFVLVKPYADPRSMGYDNDDDLYIPTNFNK